MVALLRGSQEPQCGRCGQPRGLMMRERGRIERTGRKRNLERYAESTTLKVLIMAQIHEKTVTHYKKDAHKLAGDRE